MTKKAKTSRAFARPIGLRPKNQTHTTDAARRPAKPAPRSKITFPSDNYIDPEGRTTPIVYPGDPNRYEGMRNVAEYFAHKLDSLYPKEHAKEIAACPLDSACGEECKEVIDAAAIIVKHLVRHFGLLDHNDPDASRDRRAVIDAVVSICNVIYFG